MTVYNLWGTVTIAPENDNLGSTGVSLGTVMRFNTAGQVTHLRFYNQQAVSGTVTLRIIDTTASGFLASTTYTATQGDAAGWREVPLATAWTPTVGTWYMVYYHIPYGSGGGAFGNFFYGVLPSDKLNVSRFSADNAIETMVDGAGVVFNGAVSNGRYAYGASPATPGNTFGSGNYGVDVVFDTGGGPPPTPSEGSANSDDTADMWAYAGMSLSDGSF